MLRQAEVQQEMSLIQAMAEQLPFADESIDFNFCINAVHYFDNKQRFTKQTYSVLKPGGNLAIIGMDPHEDRIQ